MKKLRITETDFILADHSTNQRIQFSAQCFRKGNIIRIGTKKMSSAAHAGDLILTT